MKIINLALLLLLVFSFSFRKAIQAPETSPSPGNRQKVKPVNTVTKNILLKSTDGGENWQDLSEGLFGASGDVELGTDCFFANENGIVLHTGNVIYHSKSNSTDPSWVKETSPNQHSKIVPGKNGMYAFNQQGTFLQKMNGTDLWSPVFKNFTVGNIRSVFETSEGKIFIGCDYGLYRSENRGKSWQRVQNKGWSMKIVESDGVLMAACQAGIIRSTDDGNTWQEVLQEGGVGIDIQPIKGGFAAINFNTISQTRRIRTSCDGGKTWQPIDAGLRGDLRTSSIIQVGESFFCGHPDGIYRSADKGKTWKLLLPSIGDKVFNLFVSGDVIYAIPLAGGC